MRAYTKKYYDAMGYTYDLFSGHRPFVPSEISGKQANDIHHIKFQGRRVDSLCATMALTTDEHSDYGERGHDEFLIKTHFSFLREKIRQGRPLIPIIVKDAAELNCELSERFLTLQEDDIDDIFGVL